MTNDNAYGNRAIRLDTSRLLSVVQIGILRDITNIGDWVYFQKDDQKIEGQIAKKYEHIFLLEDGRTFSWIDYVIGSSTAKEYLKKHHPVVYLNKDKSHNYYSMKTMRVG